MDLVSAIEDFNEAIRLNPTDYLGYVNRGHAFWDNDDLAAAIDDYSKALEFAPNNVEALGNRAGARIASGHYEEALDDIQQAILFGPDDPTGYWRRAWLRATCPLEKYRDGKQAVEDAKKGMMLNREREFHGLTTLAAAYAEAGEFDKAVECQAEAAPLAVGKQKVDCEARLELYRRGQPYRTAPKSKSL